MAIWQHSISRHRRLTRVNFSAADSPAGRSRITLPRKRCSSVGQMNETTQRRRRWPWLIVAAILLLIGGTASWSRRPLSASESALLGVWYAALPGGKGTVRLRITSDRRYAWQMDPSFPPELGDWRLEGDRLQKVPDGSGSLFPHSIIRLLRRLTGQRHPSTLITFRSPDSFQQRLSSYSLEWIRGDDDFWPDLVVHRPKVAPPADPPNGNR